MKKLFSGDGMLRQGVATAVLIYACMPVSTASARDAVLEVGVCEGAEDLDTL